MNPPDQDDPSIIRAKPGIIQTEFSNIPSSMNTSGSTTTETEDGLYIADETIPPEIEEAGTTPSPDVSKVESAETSDDNDVIETAGDIGPADEDDDDVNRVQFAEDKVDMRGESAESLRDLVVTNEQLIGREALDARTRTTGTWENMIFRSLVDVSFEEIRLQEAIKQIIAEDGQSPTSRYKDPESGKTLLRTSSILNKGPSVGEVKTVSGEEALMAFENARNNKGGGYRIPLYNSGITIDVVVPTGVDVQTMLTNCIQMDRELGATQGAHYFTYADQMYKTQVINFIQPLIVNSSYSDWRKKGKLWSIIKFPDLQAIITTIAAICYKDGFDQFVHRCSRPKSEAYPDLCRHEETFTANIFDMIVTRFSAINEECIKFLAQARLGQKRNNLTEIAKYQEGLGLEGETLTFGDVTYTMRIPTINEHLEEGANFYADIVNEIQADNDDTRYREVAVRYIRTFVPWIASVEVTAPNGGVIQTSDRRVIIRELEKFDKDDAEDVMRKGFRSYINKTQLTYVGYPVTPCAACGYSADTPSGMYTFDPFQAFFTLAFQYLKPKT